MAPRWRGRGRCPLSAFCCQLPSGHCCFQNSACTVRQDRTRVGPAGAGAIGDLVRRPGSIGCLGTRVARRICQFYPFALRALYRRRRHSDNGERSPKSLDKYRRIGAGTAVASLIGTTGAAMILIRPLIRVNEGRQRNVHVVVFFIILVANIGGALTPLGDPPLFIGFLRGIEFFGRHSICGCKP